MTSPANDTSELTAYALGELQAHQAGAIHQLLSACPAAMSELEQIEAVTEALRQRAPIPQERLLPAQRHAVLYPAQIPRLVVPMKPRPMVKKTVNTWPIMGILLKTAALITVTGAAYLAGRQVSLISSQIDVAGSQLTPVKSAPMTAAPVKVKLDGVKPAPVPAVTIAAAKPATVIEKAPVVVMPMPQKSVVMVAQAAPAKAATEIIQSAPAPTPP
jgi:hypothetical protein